ncbi:hypothetical protein [Salisediminibacterium beveridgei]|uniref:hypothetical protein n=1 Tax=Salisediminibacterium beveridgei TaxID=632773 RepID=UPI0012ECEF0B|nr:hypothetical protein [Salisediminibacterium beveridgei]
MKRLWMSLVLMMLAVVIAACGNNEATDYEAYDASDYNYALADSTGSEVNLFTEDEKGLYLYFTGVG